MVSRVSVAFIDDHPVLLKGLVGMFASLRRFKVVEQGQCAQDAVSISTSVHPDLLLIDLNMPGDAFGAIRTIQEVAPDTKVLVFTASSGIDHAVRALEAGARGYVLKGSTDEDLFAAIDSIVAGETFITPSLAAKVIASLRNQSLERSAQPLKLTVREDQIVRLLLCGRTNKEIALQLQIAEKTVKHYMTTLMQKLNARNRVEVVIAAQKLDAYHGSSSTMSRELVN
ncbi:response regulator transcription factor [Nitratireductor aquimarinus]|uniref:response regulator n=1 Tax=Alphaproteobacteria TaxID=28211 RepID=UPI0019D34285|nr:MULTISPECIES: response regulator transcription factor [Alphaproteobacteria]MBN7756647.1 response regulator transcription factor [Nitratireductor aquimarinus]MBY5999736.1 response regulator transcription factor [Tritonibacter mobilis]MBY6021762.1 response regulator transcription factor [Nitratireductor sp. DP7N14-4]